MNSNEHYFKSCYLFDHLSKTFCLLTLLNLSLMPIMLVIGIFTQQPVTYLFFTACAAPSAVIFKVLWSLCERKSDQRRKEFLTFTDEVFPDTKEEMIKILNNQKETIEVYTPVISSEIEDENTILMNKIDTYEKPKVYVKKYK